MIHAYAVMLWLYPQAFRRRYGVEMLLDFEDALCAARAGGWVAVGRFAMRALGDLAVSLAREWSRTKRLGLTVASAAITALLWGLALRPWAWLGIQPGPPAHARNAPPVTEAELLALAVIAFVPVVLVILGADRCSRSRIRSGSPSIARELIGKRCCGTNPGSSSRAARGMPSPGPLGCAVRRGEPSGTCGS